MTTESTSFSTAVVSTGWLEQNLSNPRLRIVNTDLSPDKYNAGHIPGAVFWQPKAADLFSEKMSLYLEPCHIEPLLGISGIDENSCVVFTYDEFVNGKWLIWLMTLFGLRDAYILDGGNVKWRAENRAVEIPTFAKGD